MALTVEELAHQAMELPPEARARLVDLLVESLDDGELSEIDRRWVAEAKRRLDDVRSGRVQTIPGDTVLRAVRDSVRQR